LIIIFKSIDVYDKDIIQKYIGKEYREACEYSFTTLFMWQHYYNTKYFMGDDYIVLIGEFEDKSFTIVPLSDEYNKRKAFDFIFEYFCSNSLEFSVRAATAEFVEFLEEKYPGRFDIAKERDYFDYVYDTRELISLSGRRFHKKKNNCNHFEKSYQGRYEYRRLSEFDFDECVEFMKKWSLNKATQSETLDNETIAITKLLDNYSSLDFKISGIFIDSSLEAFSIGEYLNNDMAVIHVEKANPDIRGLYSTINRLFLLNEFSDTKYVNREEDMGIEGLRRAKLSYNPVRFIEKYSITLKKKVIV